MITYIEVDGFKSLSNFKLKLNKGLNIIVGPNGAGKSNIIQFFEFLALLMENPIGKAISLAGGVGSIFQKNGEFEFKHTISCKIYGCYQIQTIQHILYEYCFIVNTSDNMDSVYYKEQNLRLQKVGKHVDFPYLNQLPPQWDLVVSGNSPKGSSFELEQPYLNIWLENEITNHLTLDKINIPGLVNSQSPIDNSLPFCMKLFTHYANRLCNELIGGDNLNLVPDKIRELEDVATPRGVQKDGKGLASTLYALQQNEILPHSSLAITTIYTENGPLRVQDNILDKIIIYLNLANSSVVGIRVENDKFYNKLIVKIEIESGGYKAVLPLSSMSDGTVKWLAFITAIFTSKSLFSIEEPENYLHPWMQAEILSIMRDQIETDSENSFILLTTHSESLLNFAKSDEIILVDMVDGRTVANRISNQELVNEEMSNTAWRLGHFYFANALEHE